MCVWVCDRNNEKTYIKLQKSENKPSKKSIKTLKRVRIKEEIKLSRKAIIYYCTQNYSQKMEIISGYVVHKN